MIPSDLPLVILDRIIAVALEEDLGAGDLTTDACIDPDAKAVAHAVARKELVVCGGPVFSRVFERIDPSLSVSAHEEEGALVGPGRKLWTVKGRARSVLMGERVALNFVQRMAGIATTTRTYVSAVPKELNTRITDSRKTTPGLRILERYAVRSGGGFNHRDNLGSAVLIKDNHVVACGGVGEAILRAKARAPHTSKIECEVDSLEQLELALAHGADVVLLDNMPTDQVAEAVRRCKGRVITEASGGVTLARIPELARTGVDVISVGALTHSIPSADVGLDFQ